jgi:hypothetical protein
MKLPAREVTSALTYVWDRLLEVQRENDGPHSVMATDILNDVAARFALTYVWGWLLEVERENDGPRSAMATNILNGVAARLGLKGAGVYPEHKPNAQEMHEV